MGRRFNFFRAVRNVIVNPIRRFFVNPIRNVIVNPIRKVFRDMSGIIREQNMINRLIPRRDSIKKLNDSLANKKINLTNQRYSTETNYNNTKTSLTQQNETLSGEIDVQKRDALKNVDDIFKYNISLNNSKNNVNLLKKNILYNTLFDINTQRNIYFSIKNENDVITKNNSILNDSASKNGQKYKYAIQHLDEILNINTVFFCIYYFLFIILCYILFYKNISIKFKILVFLLFLLYPFIIYFLEEVIYSSFDAIYLYMFPIYNIENID